VPKKKKEKTPCPVRRETLLEELRREKLCILNQTAIPFHFDFDPDSDHRDRFEGEVFHASDGGRLPYRLLKPPGCSMSAPQRLDYPLVVFLHGAGERGDDNQRQLVHGMNEFASDPIRKNFPCFVVAPQCPEDQQWVDTPWYLDSHRMAAEPTPVLRWTLELVQDLTDRYPVDPNRIYLTGLSMGGFGVWEVLARQPARFAAAVIVCGGGDPATAAEIARIPVWVFHGDQDPEVLPQRSREMIRALQQAGGSPRYTEYPNTGHDSWSPTYRDHQMYAWLFAQRLGAPIP
jgi:predicted peptidase